MDKSSTMVAERPVDSEATSPSRRGILLPVIAVLAVAAALFALVALRTEAPAPTTPTVSDVGLKGGSAALPAAPHAAAEAHGSADVAPKAPAAPAVAPALPLPLPALPVPAAPVAAAPAATPSGGSCIDKSTVGAFIAHFKAGHLEPSLAAQVADLLNIDQYVKTHTVLIENMIVPLLGSNKSTLDAFLTHFKAGHLQLSPLEQVADILSTDQYVKTHTVLIENMIIPLLQQKSC
jgi:hypothetical protein